MLRLKATKLPAKLTRSVSKSQQFSLRRMRLEMLITKLNTITKSKEI